MIRSKILQITDARIVKKNQILWTSAEGDNPGGSIKDHMVYEQLQKLFQQDLLKKNDWVSEVSAGSTALSLAYYAKQFQLKCHLFVPDHLPREKIDHLRSYGATLHLNPTKDCYQRHDEFLKANPDTYFFNQLWDQTKQIHYQPLAKTFLKKMESVDVVIGAVGTGHSLKGIANSFPNALLLTAEPLPPESCLGVRNIEAERYGESDPCRLSDFDKRIIVPKINFFPDDLIETSAGRLRICESFRMVIGALLQNDAFSASESILMVGAQNHFQFAK